MKFKSIRNIIKTREWLTDFVKMTMGTMIMAIGIEQFLLPCQLSTGGFSGIATIIYYIFKIPVGTTILLLNIPLFIIAYLKLGKKFFINALLGTMLFSFFLNLFENISPVTTDRFLAFIYGSIIDGIGTAIVLKSNSSTGGTELLSNIIRKFNPHVKVVTLMVIFDTIIVASNTLFFGDIEIALYSALAIYVMGKILDIFFEGIGFTKMIFVISPKWQEISDKIHSQIRRGTTALYGKGMYSKENKEVLLCVLSRQEIREARRIIKEIDNSAFIIITNAREVFGEGFKKTY